jgi:hypothetical protein
MEFIIFDLQAAAFTGVGPILSLTMHTGSVCPSVCLSYVVHMYLVKHTNPLSLVNCLSNSPLRPLM